MEFTDFEARAEMALADCNGAVKHCAKNALHHLKKAWLLREVDLEMAVFRGITAEEEVASSLFLSLKNQRYMNADKISFKSHAYKLALHPFLLSIGDFLRGLSTSTNFPFNNFKMQHIERKGKKAISLHLHMKKYSVHVAPIPPLNFTIRDQDTGLVSTFEVNFNKLLEQENCESVKKYVKNLTIERTRLLYADTKGYLKVVGDIQGYLENQKRKIFAVIYLILMIDPWADEGRSAFVQQALDSFLLLMGRIQEFEIQQPDIPDLV